MFLLTACNTETPEQRRKRLYNEWWAWAVKQPEPPLTLKVPTVVDGSFNIVATSSEEATVRVWIDDEDEPIARTAAEVSHRVFLPDGEHTIRAKTQWCFTPDREELQQFGETCPTATAKAHVLVDSSPPLWSDVHTEAQEKFVLVTGEMDDLSQSTARVGSVLVNAVDGAFSLKVPYDEIIPNEAMKLIFADKLSNVSYTYLEVPLPQTFWGRYDQHGVLQELQTDRAFEPPLPLLGYGSDEWRHYIDGVERPGWYTPTEFYIGLWAAVLVLFVGGAAGLVWTVTMPGRRLANTIQTRIEAALPPPTEQLALPPAAIKLLSDFAEQHPEAAKQLELFLVEQQERPLLTRGGENV